MIVRAVKTRIFREGEDLADFVISHVPKLKDGSILAVASKIVSLSENRIAPFSQKKQLIKSESSQQIRTKYVSLTVKDGMILPNAGIDESNGDGRLILLPKDSYKSAERLREKLKKKYKVRKLGIIVVDSWVTPMRAGVTGLALGYAGFRGIRQYKGKKDIFGRKFNFSSVNVADSLATSAMLEMGEGSERRPLATITGVHIDFSERVKTGELRADQKSDMYFPLIERLPKRHL